MVTISAMGRQNYDEAQQLLRTRGNDTHGLIFQRLVTYHTFLIQSHRTAPNGKVVRRTKANIEADRKVADELARILSWEIGYTTSFWLHAAITAKLLEDHPGEDQARIDILVDRAGA